MTRIYGYSRAPFAERCSCDHETEDRHCICVRKLEPPTARCEACRSGRHRLVLKYERSVREALKTYRGML